MGSRTWVRHLAAAAGYLGITAAFSWPLPLHLGSQLLGPPGGDTGVYAWNLWLFRHEIVAHGSSPLFTNEILSLSPPLPLTLHNYTLAANLVAYPLIPLLGVTATFNLIHLAALALAAYAMFLLAWHLTRSAGPAWLAGASFGFSPVLIARGTSHFSLVQAAPLPIFLLLVHRLDRGGRTRDALLLGATLAWAYMSDPYYAVYAVLLGAGYLVLSRVRVDARAPSRRRTQACRAIGGLIALLLAVSVGIVIGGGTRVDFGMVRLSATTAYTPMLVATLLAALLYLLTRRLSWPRRPGAAVASRLRVMGPAALALAVLMLPALSAMLAHPDASWVRPDIFWRSSPAGVDALAFLLPNPNHALFGGAAADWLGRRPGGYAENVGSLGWTALATIAVAFAAYHFRRHRPWMTLTAVFGLMALGPFLQVAGINSQAPTPWALLRYVPVLGAARTPARLSVVVTLLVAVLFALAVKRVAAAHGPRRTWVLVGVGSVLLFELSPAPRPLYSAAVPHIYQTIADDAREVRVLEIPFGVRDGLSSYGDFSAASQFYQTFHEKRLVGGYLSRMPAGHVSATRRDLVLHAFATLSEGRPVADGGAAQALEGGPDLVDRARLGYVVVDLQRASARLVRFAESALRLTPLGEDGGRRLYRTPCCPPSAAGAPARR